MQSNSSASGSLGALNVCGGEEDDISRVVSLTGAASNLAALNLSLNCWLLILSKESSLDLHADGANLAVGLVKNVQIQMDRNGNSFSMNRPNKKSAWRIHVVF